MKMAFLSIHSSPVGKAGGKDTGGMSTYLCGLSEALGAMGHKVDIFSRSVVTGAEGIHKMYPNVRLVSFDDGNGSLAKNDIYPHISLIAAEINRLCQQNQCSYDVIFSHYWLSGCVGEILKQNWQIPTLVMFHTLGRAKNEACPEENEPSRRISEEENLARNSDLIITAARLEKERILNYYNLPPRKVEVIPCGIGRMLFKPLDRQKAKEQIGLDSKKIILAVGRIEPVKGFDFLIETTALLPLRDDIKLVIVGGDEQSRDQVAALKEKAASLGMEDRVQFTGRIDHQSLPLYYNAADVTVIPSYYESFALTALESIACGTRIVGAPVGILPEIFFRLPGGHPGCLITDRTPDLWATKIREAIFRTEKISPAEIETLLFPFNWTGAAARLTGLIAGLRS